MFTGKHLVKGGSRRRSCHLYHVLLESSRFILKPFDLRGLRSDILRVLTEEEEAGTVDTAQHTLHTVLPSMVVRNV